MTGLKETRHKPFACLECGAMLDATTSTDPREERTPCQPGAISISICIKCHALAAFETIEEGVKLRPLTDEEMHAVAGRKELIDAMRSIEQFEHVRKLRRAFGDLAT